MIDESELERLGVKGIGDVAEIGGHHVRVVGLVKGKKSLAAPYILCSIETARMNLRMLPDQATYILGRCKNPAELPPWSKSCGTFQKLSAFTAKRVLF